MLHEQWMKMVPETEDPLQTVLLRRVKGIDREADLVISKGGGNFDTLEGEKDLGADISFMLLSKCIPYCRYFQTGMFQPILANFFAS